ncbi:hypothetical protein [Streptomyces sp. SID1121]|uniref:hypothetical protein n=1 Tax=Streptomyces sp. SID1121 TaxID=3425888 RepID=UPI0040570123
MSHRLKPRLATALFRHYLRAGITIGPTNFGSPTPRTRPEAAPTPTHRVGRHHH